MTIDEFIKNEITKPFEWGITDCCSTANRWVYISSGVNFLEKSGFIFSSKDDAIEILKVNLIKLFSDLCETNKFKRTNFPKSGDLGLIKIYENGKPTVAVAIKYKNGWFSHAESGCFFLKEAKVIRSYECPNL